MTEVKHMHLNAIIQVAKELEELAKSSVAKLRSGEQITHEQLKNGVYSRESVFEGETYLVTFDFKTRTADFNKVTADIRKAG